MLTVRTIKTATTPETIEDILDSLMLLGYSYEQAWRAIEESDGPTIRVRRNRDYNLCRGPKLSASGLLVINVNLY